MAARRPIEGPTNYRVAMATFRVVRDPEAPWSSRPVLGGPEEVVTIARQVIPDDGREHFVAFYLNAQNRLIAAHEVSVGSLSATLVTPRETFGPALRLVGVANVILAHNHPSGDPTPSREDLRLTRQLADAARLLDLTVHDHIIIGNGTGAWVSLAERGLI